MNSFTKFSIHNVLRTTNIVKVMGNQCKFSTIHVPTSADLENKLKNISFSQIQILVNNLNTAEQKKLLVNLQNIESMNRMKVAEEKLASWHWRSRYGRPIVQKTSDPSGKFCEIPADWLQKKVDEQAQPKKIASSELRQVAIINALPFIGFGFLDNVIMIVAGDYIDITIGTYLGISTLAAAAFGNTISDLAGIGSAFYVEVVATKIGVRSPNLTPAQLDSSSARWFSNIGRSIGVVLGCLLGMFPLFFLPHHPRKVKSEEADA